MTAVLAKFDYSYVHGGKTISFKIGDRFSLIKKANSDWWHVKRDVHNGEVEEIYVPVLYVEEVEEQPSFSTMSLDRRVTKKMSNEKVESSVENEILEENIYENLKKPAPPPPQPKERTPQPPKIPEKNTTLPRTLSSGSTFGTTISPKEFPDNPASPPLVSPVRSTPSPPFVPPKPVSRAGSSDRLMDSKVTSPTGPPPVKARTLSTYKKSRHSSNNALEEPGETSTFLSRSMPATQNSLPVKGNQKAINRTISAEVHDLCLVIIN